MANRNIVKGNIGNALHSVAPDHILGVAEDIFDEDKQMYQSDINSSQQANVGYYECDTAADVALKEVAATGYVLTVGGSIKIKMTNKNSAENATLNINSTGAKSLYYEGIRVSANNTWDDNETIEVYYDGTNYYANNVAGGGGDGVLDVSEKYPTSGVEGGNTYTLDGALTVLNANLPARKKKGGMSIKFVQSSDNKYVQFRLMADEWSTNTEDWAIANEGVYVENPEFIYVKTDAEGKILWAIKADGSIYYGAGVPPQIIDYINEKIAELSLDEYEDIVAFLNDLEKGDKTLQTLLDEKVDKEDGKSLIDEEYADGVHYIENPEFVGVWLDNDEHILFGVQTDGNFLFGCGVPKQVKDYIEDKIAELSLDEYEDIVAFLGNLIEGDETLADLLSGKVDKIEGKGLSTNDFTNEEKSIVDISSEIENLEFLEVITDSNKKILEGIRKDGSKYIGGDLQVDGNIINEGLQNTIGQITPLIQDINANTEYVSKRTKIDGSVDRMLVPDYYTNDYLWNKKQAILEYWQTCATNGDMFVFITDTHWDTANQKHSPALIKHFNSYLGIPRLFHGGDMYTYENGNYEYDMNLRLEEAMGNNRIYYVLGNHEYINYHSYSYVQAIYGVRNYDANYGGDNLNYYYIDNNQAKIRYIVLAIWGERDSSTGEYYNAFDTNQVNWFTNVALNVEQGWTIVIFSHGLFQVRETDNVLFMNQEATPIVNAIEAYNGNGTIACVILGHSHKDRIHYLSNDVPVVLVASDQNGINDTGMDRPSGTISEQAFDIVVLNKNDRELKFFRVGANAKDGVDNDPGNEVQVRTVTY